MFWWSKLPSFAIWTMNWWLRNGKARPPFLRSNRPWEVQTWVRMTAQFRLSHPSIKKHYSTSANLLSNPTKFCLRLWTASRWHCWRKRSASRGSSLSNRSRARARFESRQRAKCQTCGRKSRDKISWMLPIWLLTRMSRWKNTPILYSIREDS